MILHSMGITLDKAKTVFDSLESIFRLESNQTLSRFEFTGLKQRQGQYVTVTCQSTVHHALYIHSPLIATAIKIPAEPQHASTFFLYTETLGLLERVKYRCKRVILC